MKILSYNTRHNRLVALVSDREASLLQRFPTEEMVLRDIDGYGNDDTMIASSIKVESVDMCHVSTLLAYRHYVEDGSQHMFDFIAKLTSRLDEEEYYELFG